MADVILSAGVLEMPVADGPADRLRQGYGGPRAKVDQRCALAKSVTAAESVRTFA